MPCGGIVAAYDGTFDNPIRPVVSEEEGTECFECGERGADCSLEEWDSGLHSDCVEGFLKSDAGQIVLLHKHIILFWRDGRLLLLQEEGEN